MPFMRRSFRRAYFRPVWYWQAYANRHQRRHAGPRITLSSRTIEEDAAIGDLIGTLSVVAGSGSYDFTQTLGAGSAVLDAVDDTRLEVAGALDYESQTSFDVAFSADNGVDTPINATFAIFVENVLEVTLAALTLSASSIQEGTAQGVTVGAVVGKSTGSTLSLTGTAGSRFALSGTNIVTGSVATDYDTATSHNITLRETHADGNNSPRDSVIVITVTEIVAPGAFAPTYYFLGF